MLHVVADENMPAVEQLLGSSVRVTRCNGRSLQRDQLRDADVLFVRSVTQVNSELLVGTPVRFVGTATSGTEHVDTAWLAEQGIGFTRAAGSNANSVAEYVLSAIAVEGEWLERLMAGGCVGIVGYGPVGQAVAALLGALGGRCKVYDPWLVPDTVPGHATLQQILECDFICLHAELTRREPWPSYHLLGDGALAGLGKSQMLINASRGAVIDNGALSQRLAQADNPRTVLDVWETEPEVDLALLEKINLGTAHIAGYSLDGKILATRMLCEALASNTGLQLSDAGQQAQDSLPLSVREGTDGAALVRELILQRYDVREDDQRLRAACGRTEAVGAAFDALRKHYPERRELAGSAVSVQGASQSQLGIIRALGCKPL